MNSFEIFACPQCESKLEAGSESLKCLGCGTNYPVRNGINNLNWQAFGLAPIELALRPLLGKVFAPEALADILAGAVELSDAAEQYSAAISAARDEYIYNYGAATHTAAAHLARLLEQAN